MGITTYLFHRSDCLEDQRFNMFFLDMGENIHIHYRDLRIELSVDEFIELAELFNDAAQQVLQEIEHGYRDGVLANTNETNTLKTFWDKNKPLTTPVAYNEKRLAIEETRDGYHLHFRNYKILLGEHSFKTFIRAMAKIAPLLDDTELTRDPFDLLTQNELQPHLISRHQEAGRDELRVAIKPDFCKKANQVLRAIGYNLISEMQQTQQYTRGASIVNIVRTAEKKQAEPAPVKPDSPLGLQQFLVLYGTGLDAQQLNQLKLRVLFLLKQAEAGNISPFQLRDIYINPVTLTPAVDIFASAENGQPAEEVQKFTSMLIEQQLFFIKPDKVIFSPETIAAIQDRFFRFIHEKIACHAYVKKIVVLGSMTNLHSGTYKVPFVHFDWAKINSDFDIYVEIDPDYEGEFPSGWEKKFYWHRAGADYYHFGELGDGMKSQSAKQYPGIRFYDHLIEGYIFDYRSGDRAKRDQWLKEVKGQCIFKRDRLAQWLADMYPLDRVQDTEPINVASFNKVYSVQTISNRYILKHYGTTYLSAQDKERINYELALLDALSGKGLNIALPVKNRAGTYLTKDERSLSVLFSFVPGSNLTDPDQSQIHTAGRLLAQFHQACQGIKIKKAKQFNNKTTLDYWLQAWQHYQSERVIGTDLDIQVLAYQSFLQNLKTRPGHCHGDLSVINYLFEKKQCWLIDFQNVCFGPLIADLANGMVEFSTKKAVFVFDNAICFREGYEEIRPLDTKEKDALVSMMIIQSMARQAKLMRLHFGGFGYDLKEERLLGLKAGISGLLQHGM